MLPISLWKALRGEFGRVKSSLNEIFEALEEPIIRRYLARALVLSLVFAILLVTLNQPVADDDVRAILTTLATAEASILAIVYSVTVVAFQLVTTRYSSRLTSLFIEAPLYRVTFALFVISIAANLGFAYLFEGGSRILLNAEIGVAFGLAIVSVIALYQFIRSIIERSTPESLIDSIVEQELLPEDYIPKLSADSEYYRVHPLHPLNSTATQAMKRDEFETVLQAVLAFDEVLKSSIQYIKETYGGQDEARELVEGISERPLSEYYPVLAIKLEQANQDEIYTEIIDSSKEVALDGIQAGYTNTACYASDGLATIHDEAPRCWEGTRLRDEAIEAGVEICKSTAQNADIGEFRHVLYKVNNQLVVALRRKLDQQSLDRYLLKYYGTYQVEILEVLLNRFSVDIDESTVDWFGPSASLDDDAAQYLFELWRNRVKLTKAMLFYRQNTGDFPVAEGNMRDGWAKAIEKSIEAALPSLGTLFCVSMIEAAYAIEKIHSKDSRLFINSMANLRIDHSEQVVDEAFELLKTEDRVTAERMPRFASVGDEESDGLIRRLTQDSETFTEWVRTRHEDVVDRTDYLRDEVK